MQRTRRNANWSQRFQKQGQCTVRGISRYQTRLTIYIRSIILHPIYKSIPNLFYHLYCLRAPPRLLLFHRVRDPDKHSRLINAVMLIAKDTLAAHSIRLSVAPSPQNPYTSWLDHHRQWECHGVVQPALDKGTQYVAMSKEHDITTLLSVHVWTLEAAYLVDKRVEASRHLSRRSESSRIRQDRSTRS